MPVEKHQNIAFGFHRGQVFCWRCAESLGLSNYANLWESPNSFLDRTITGCVVCHHDVVGQVNCRFDTGADRLPESIALVVCRN